MKRFLAFVVIVAAVTLTRSLGQNQSTTGPATEKRFPPLKTPADFKATLFACDPLIEYPSALALGPRPGTAFVAVDYLTGLGVDIVRRDEIRLIADSDNDGYADRATLFAEGFNSIQGMTFHAGAVYVMHAPLLTVLRDTDGDDKADERRDLVSGLGLAPEKNPPRLHCANGVVMGHDGWLYLALGDHGCDVRRSEGDRLVLEGGGILRCRPDGRDLHVFATGLRNIYDVALDAQLNVFVRDNENDGGDYKIRFCHSFFGADHGYPYHYYERPDEALAPLADLGLGSSAGGAAYLETQFPTPYRNNLFFCEWGRSVVRYAPQPAGSAFAKTSEEVFAYAADNDPYGFKPTDIVVERDGSLLVSDWADGQRPKRGRGRIYRIQYVGGTGETPVNRRRESPGGDPLTPAALSSASHHARIEAHEALLRQGPAGVKAVIDALQRKQLEPSGRMHAVWLIAAAARSAQRQQVERDRAAGLHFDLARSDADVSVRVQAVRALADILDPVLVEHRLDAGPGDAATAKRLAALTDGQEPRVLLEVIVALGRLRWAELPEWLPKTLTKPDAALAHAAMQALRRSGNWPGVLRLLDAPDDAPLRPIALRALAEQAEAVVVDGLIERLTKDTDVQRRRDYANLLTRAYKKPGSWVYWGYRPGPRPANSTAWDRTDAIAAALDRLLADGDPTVRLTVLQRMLRENVPTKVNTLGRWLREEKQAASVTALISALRQHPAKDTASWFGELVRDSARPESIRREALTALANGLANDETLPLLVLAKSLEDGPVLCEVLGHLGKRPGFETAAVLLGKLDSREPAVRTAALDALSRTSSAGVIDGGRVVSLLGEQASGLRRAAADAAGRWRLRAAIPKLLEAARDRDAEVRRASLEALRLMKEPRAVAEALTALSDSVTHQTALQYLADLGGPEHAPAIVKEVRRQAAPASALLALETFTRWRQQPGAKRAELDRLGAELQGAIGLLGAWRIAEAASQPDPAAWSAGADVSGAPMIVGRGLEARVKLSPATLAAASFTVPEAMTVQFLAGSSVPLRVSLNGKTVYRRGESRSFQIDGERFTAAVIGGLNRLVVQLDDAKRGGEFHVRFRRVSSKAEHEQLTQAALSRPGNAERGRTVLLDVQKSQCLKCHRLGDDGERIGPELTGVGSRFPRAYLIESILEPSRAMAPSFQTWMVLLKNGRSLSGVKIDERGGAATFADQKGDKHMVKLADIDEQRPSPQSTMPDGLERQLSVEEFVDLIAFLTAQKER